MHSIVFCLSFLLLPFIQYRTPTIACANEDSKHPRFILEDDFKPAIFGSFHYDPVHENFNVEYMPNKSQFINESYVYSTAVGGETLIPPGTTIAVLRKKAFPGIINISTPRPTAWWARKLLKNLTKSNYT